MPLLVATLIMILGHDGRWQLYLQCLTSVPLLKTLDDEEIAKLIDILQPRK